MPPLKVRPSNNPNDVYHNQLHDTFKSLEDNEDFTYDLLVATAMYENLELPEGVSTDYNF